MNLSKEVKKFFTFNEFNEFYEFFKSKLKKEINNELFEIIYYVSVIRFQKIHQNKLFFDEYEAMNKHISYLTKKYLILAIKMDMIWQLKQNDLEDQKNKINYLINEIIEINTNNSKNLLKKLPIAIQILIKRAGLYTSIITDSKISEPEDFDVEKIKELFLEVNSIEQEKENNTKEKFDKNCKCEKEDDCKTKDDCKSKDNCNCKSKADCKSKECKEKYDCHNDKNCDFDGCGCESENEESIILDEVFSDIFKKFNNFTQMLNSNHDHKIIEKKIDKILLNQKELINEFLKIKELIKDCKNK